MAAGAPHYPLAPPRALKKRRSVRTKRIFPTAVRLLSSLCARYAIPILIISCAFTILLYLLLTYASSSSTGVIHIDGEELDEPCRMRLRERDGVGVAGRVPQVRIYASPEPERVVTEYNRLYYIPARDDDVKRILGENFQVDAKEYLRLIQSPRGGQEAVEISRGNMPLASSFYYYNANTSLQKQSWLLEHSEISESIFAFPVGALPRESDGRPPRVYLSTLIAAWREEEVAMFTHFVRHYMNSGIPPSDMLFTLQTNDIKSPSFLAIVASALDFGVQFDVWIGNYSSTGRMFYQLLKVDYTVRAKDWLVVADADEFQQYPVFTFRQKRLQSEQHLSAFEVETMDIPTFACLLDQQGVDWAGGYLIDRLAHEGELKDVEKFPSIFQQFPYECKGMTKLLAGWRTAAGKVSLMRGNLRPNRGQHRLLDRRNMIQNGISSRLRQQIHDNGVPWGCWIRIHHFKWVRGLHSYLRARAERYAAQGFSWASQSDAIVEAIALDSEGGQKIKVDKLHCINNPTEETEPPEARSPFEVASCAAGGYFRTRNLPSRLLRSIIRSILKFQYERIQLGPIRIA